MVDSFVGGVRDAQALRGFVEVLPNEVVAVDLARGVVLWRRSGIGRPIAATSDRLLTLDCLGDRYMVRLIDAASGSDAGRIENPGMPDWAAQTGLAADAVQVVASETPEGVRLEWRLRQPYRGGAPPPARISSKAREEVTGALIVDLKTSRLVPTAPALSEGAKAAASTRQVSSDSSVFALERIHDREFCLKVAAEGVTIEARDARNGALLWDVLLSSESGSRPTPQRQ